MPELPEAETIRRDLDPVLSGKTLDFLWFHSNSPVFSLIWGERPFDPFSKRIIFGVNRVGKYVLIEFERWSHRRGEAHKDPSSQSSGLSYPDALVFGLGMTGQLFVTTEYLLPVDIIEEVNHIQIIAAILDQGVKQGFLVFRDSRKFGKVFPTNFYTDSQDHRVYNSSRLMGLGPDAFSITPAKLLTVTSRLTRNIKQVLIDQKIIAGIGNIYASEILFDARVDPQRIANKISFTEWERIVDSTLIILNKAIECRGSTISDYRDGQGRAGTYQNYHKVYGKKDNPCPLCGTAISRIDIDGRSTYFCSNCQR